MARFIAKTLLFISFFGIVYGFIAPNYDGYVTDTVGVFSDTQKSDLTTKIEEIEKTSGIEIAVLVLPTVDDDINLAAVDVGNQWGVGKKGQNNGLLLLLAVNDKKWSIQVGYGLEGVLPDIITKRIGEARFPPNFREGNYYQGIVEMLDDVLGYIKQDPTLVQTYSQNTSSASTSDRDYMSIFIIIFVFVISFGRWVTIPSSKGKGAARSMKKYGWLLYILVGFVLSLVVTWLIANFVVSLIVSYIFLLFGVLMGLYGKQNKSVGGIRYGGHGGGSWGGGGGFGGFGGGSFGGGGSSGSR